MKTEPTQQKVWILILVDNERSYPPAVYDHEPSEDEISEAMETSLSSSKSVSIYEEYFNVPPDPYMPF
jgi:hypothetical protein